MAFNGAGVFQRLYDFITDRDGDIRIRADRMDAELYGIADGLSNAICKDGQTVISADIPFNGKKITNLGDATGNTDALNRQSGDARFLRRPVDLTAETALDDGDIFGFYDLSALADRGILYSALKTALTTDFRADGRMVPVGTREPFQQTTPPTGYTKESNASYNDAVLRFTTGTVSTSGVTAMATVFASRTFTGSIGSDTPSISKTAAHTHPTSGQATTAGTSNTSMTGNGGTGVADVTGSTGSGTSHNHALTMNAADFDVKRVDCCIGIKA